MKSNREHLQQLSDKEYIEALNNCMLSCDRSSCWGKYGGCDKCKESWLSETYYIETFNITNNGGGN